MPRALRASRSAFVGVGGGGALIAWIPRAVNFILGIASTRVRFEPPSRPKVPNRFQWNRDSMTTPDHACKSLMSASANFSAAVRYCRGDLHAHRWSCPAWLLTTMSLVRVRPGEPIKRGARSHRPSPLLRLTSRSVPAGSGLSEASRQIDSLRHLPKRRFPGY